jgi:mono/diheme cytochrome c family protein
LNRWALVILGCLLTSGVNASQAQGPSGQDLVKCLSCQGCHALAGRGGNLGPGWDGVGQRLAPEAIKKQLVSPKGHMPNFAHLKPEELDAVVAYLSGLK